VEEVRGDVGAHELTDLVPDGQLLGRQEHILEHACLLSAFRPNPLGIDARGRALAPPELVDPTGHGRDPRVCDNRDAGLAQRGGTDRASDEGAGTELPVILRGEDGGIPFLDTTQIHVQATVERLLT
jgi:hypothetical protein